MQVKSGDVVSLLFVYGTLKRGHHNNRLLRDAEFIKEDEAPGILYGGYVPVVTPPKEGEQRWVKGELFLVDAPTLRHCDLLEGHGRGGYTRALVTLKSGTKAFIYYWPNEVRGTRIESGEWLSYARVAT